MAPGLGNISRLAAALVVAACLIPGMAPAATYTVNNTTDAVDASPGNGTCATAGGFCTLRAAIMEANASAGRDTILVPSGTYLLTRAGAGEDGAATGDLDIDNDVVILGQGTPGPVIDANGLDRLFDVKTGGVVLTVEHAVLRGGAVSGDGGCVQLAGSSDVTMRDVTVTGHSATGSGGAFYVHSGVIRLTNATVSGNSAAQGGGIFVHTGNSHLTNVTITANTATGSGAGARLSGGVITNTIIAGNLVTNDCASAGGAGFNNLDGDGSCGFATTGAPLLGPLADNGGFVTTHAPAFNSPAIDAGTATGAPATDARGFPRPRDGNHDGSSLYDIGAFEAEYYKIEGVVYHDLDNDGVRDANEFGIGNVWVKLLLGGVVVQAVQANRDSGQYTFPGLLNGNYTVIIDTTGAMGDVSVNVPPNWLFRTPISGSRAVVVNNASVSGQDFGHIFDFDLDSDCACGYDNGLFTQATITIDGNISDWALVLSDGDNNACDATDNTDRDYPVQSTGRNMVRAAVTYNATHLAILTQRVGSSSNTQTFLYYADSNNDGRMQTGEYVITARWSGSTGNVVLERWTYNASAGGGDPLLDNAGFADGHNMPGSLSFVNAFPAANARGATTGDEAGVQMEWRVTWGDLGVASGSAISWHISSTNVSPGSGSLPSQIDDNLGGCGGQCAGTNQFGSVTPLPVSSAPGDTTFIFHKVVNTGNGLDNFDITTSFSGAWAPVAIVLYRDLGTQGVHDGADVLLTDTDGDLIPDTGNLAPGDSMRIVVGVVTPPPPAIGTTNVTTIATSNFFPGCGKTVSPVSGTITAALTIPGADLRATKTDGLASAEPGDVLTYTITVRNFGPRASVDAILTDPLDATRLDVAAATWSAAVTGVGSVTPASGAGNPNATIDLDSASVATVTVQVPVLWTATGMLHNRARIGAINETDTDTTNNVGVDSTLIGTRVVSGRVLEDPNADGALGDGAARPGAIVRLFVDDGDNVPEATDPFVTADTTDAAGAWSFTAPATSTCWVVVQSRTVTPAAGFNAGAGPDSIWMEQTHGPLGGWCDDGAGGTTERVAAGACHGGRRQAISDGAATPATAEHLARVVVAGADVTGLDFGFTSTLVVNTRDGDDDAGPARTVQGSLRQLVQNANAIAGAQTTSFRIPNSDANRTPAPLAWTVTPTSPLPAITQGLVLDATNQPGWTAAPVLALDGPLAGAAANGLEVASAGVTIRGFSIGRFGGAGIRHASGAGTVVRGNHLGLDVGGTLDRGNGSHGIEVVAAAGAFVGGVAAGEPNRIAYNGGSGVAVYSGATDVSIRRNAIDSNDGLAIDLSAVAGAGDGVTANDPGDADVGGNQRQNYPVLTTAIVGGGSTTVQGTMSAAASTTYTIDLYSCPVADPSGFGEAAVWLGSDVVTTNGAGTATFTTVLGSAVALGQVVTATATDPVGNTSELCAALAVQPVSIVKRAYLLDGTPIADGATLPRGTAFQFLLYVNNPGGLIPDLTVRDALDPAFAYQAGTIRFDASTPSCPTGGCSPAQEAAIWAATNGGTAGSDPVNADVVSFAAGTVHAGNANVANAQLDIPAGRVWAVRFVVRMQ